VVTVVEHPVPAWLGWATEGVGLPVEGNLESRGRSELLTHGPDGQRRGEGLRVFCASYAPKTPMLVFGAIDFGAALARLGSFVGYYVTVCDVTVCDARPVLRQSRAWPQADEMIVAWPHRYLSEQVAAGRAVGRGGGRLTRMDGRIHHEQ
jgi:xanthine dehydrogenase accessory factor